MTSSIRWAVACLLAVTLLHATSCSDSSTDSVSGEVRECTYNSDCESPLVCLYGQCVAECVAQVDCAAGYDCVNGSCEAGDTGGGAGGSEPLPENCSNGVKDADETDVDCGGMCAPCSSSKGCTTANDCASKNCLMGVCQAATCADSIANGDESDVDCGGASCPACDNGSACTAASDCVSGICSGGLCVEASCVDGIKNGDESDVDCGGSCSPCDATKGCSGGEDCTSGVCAGGVCQQPSCSDGIKNGNETDLDCGASCDPCGTSKGCMNPSDCLGGVCQGGLCLAPECNDTVKNGEETDVDCGGATCPACADTAACDIDDDCSSGACVGNVCTPTFVLSVVKAGAGSGYVGGAVSGIDCGSVCTGKYVTGVQVTLSATADGGSTFTGWSGGGCSGTGNCIVAMNQAQVVTASFSANQVGAHSWSLGYGSTSADVARAVAVGADGAVAATGSFKTGIDFGGGLLTPSNSSDTWVMVVDSSGTYSWARRFGFNGDDWGSAVTLDSQGDVLLAGHMNAAHSLGAQGAEPCASAAFFAKYAGSNGAYQWSHCVSNNPTVTQNVVDSADNLISVGYYYSQNTDFGGGAIGSFGNGNNDGFIVKYNGAGGSFVWAKKYGGSSHDYIRDVAIDGADNLYIAGSFTNSMNVGGAGLVGNGSNDIFAAKLDADGDHIWSSSFGDSFSDIAFGLAVDSQGDVVVAGSYEGAIDFGGGPLTSQGSSDIFVMKLSGTDGSYIWAKRFGGANADTAVDVEIHDNDEIVITSTIGSNVDFGAGPVSHSGGTTDIAVMRFSSAGAVIWANSYGTSGNDVIHGLALDSLGSPVLAGGFPASISFGGGFLPHVGSTDIFIVKLTP